MNSSLSAPGMESEEVEACIERMNGLDTKVVSHIYRHCNNLMEFKAVQSDKRSRYNRAQLLSGDPSIGCRNMDSKSITGDQVGCGRN